MQTTSTLLPVRAPRFPRFPIEASEAKPKGSSAASAARSDAPEISDEAADEAPRSADAASGKATGGHSTLTFRTLLVDDEPHARQRLRILLESHPEIVVVGECSSGAELLDAVRAHEPDLVFLDIEMPGLNGLAAWRQIPTGKFPHLIVVTAHANFAVQGFDLSAVDYLLKPVARGRLEDAVHRLRNHRRAGDDGYTAPTGAPASVPAARRIVLKHDGKFHIVRSDEILWARAEGDFLKVKTDATSHLIRQSLNSFEELLESGKFLRIHRSYIVSLGRVRKFFVVQRSDYAIELTDGTVFRVSRKYLDEVKRALGIIEG